MAKPATQSRLGGRLAVCQATGIVIGIPVGSLIGSLFGEPHPPLTGSYFSDYLMVLVYAFAASVPFYAAAALVLIAFARNILAHPVIWCLGIPILALVATLVAFPPGEYRGFPWMALPPLCASVAGAAFVWWQARVPLVYVR